MKGASTIAVAIILYTLALSLSARPGNLRFAASATIAYVEMRQTHVLAQECAGMLC